MATGIVGEFFQLKDESGADLLAMQVGDFYEFFGKDAQTVSKELDLKVSQRSAGGEPYDMAGVPVDDVMPYIVALVERGYRVGLADQHETADGDIHREVSRIVTPGTLLETTDQAAQYLAAIVAEGDTYGLAFCDVPTGRFRVTELTDIGDPREILAEVTRMDPVELLPGPNVPDTVVELLSDNLALNITSFDQAAFAPGRARHTLTEQFGDITSVVGIESDVQIASAGAILTYIDETGVGTRASITRLETYTPDEHVTIDATTQRNLELVDPMTSGGKSLLETIDQTVTNPGRRLLREWLTRPVRVRSIITHRQESITSLVKEPLVRESVREMLAEAYDLERIASRAVSGRAGADELLRARDSLELIEPLCDAINNSPQLAESPLGSLISELDMDAVQSLLESLAALSDDPPKTLREGGLIRPGENQELDELIEKHEAALTWFETLEERESTDLDISRLSVGRNKTDGYYIQVAKSEASKVPAHYEGIKTLKNAERYVFSELKDREREVFRLEAERHELEYELFSEIRSTVAAQADVLQSVGAVIAKLDVYCSLAVHAAKHGWECPSLTTESKLTITAGRHPVVETEVEFVPNNLYLDRETHFLLVTGPNMSGKSTYMRQAALITLLAQVGSYVPADSATVGLVDGIYTRVGAMDELAGGRSTFMVEMSELSNILHSASANSLVILDEVGRGTATYDGISIAWAATEYLANSVGALTLFATHYHELTELADRLPGLENVHMGAVETDGDVTFLRTVEPGAADRSYGIHVAKLASVPDPVVDRATDVLQKLRTDKALDVRGSGDGSKQVVFDIQSGTYRQNATSDGGEPDPFDPQTESVLEELKNLDINETPPIELLQKVSVWQQRIDD